MEGRPWKTVLVLVQKGAIWCNDWQLLVLKEAVLHWSRKDSRRMGGKTVPQNGEGGHGGPYYNPVGLWGSETLGLISKSRMQTVPTPVNFEKVRVTA